MHIYEKKKISIMSQNVNILFYFIFLGMKDFNFHDTDPKLMIETSLLFMPLCFQFSLLHIPGKSCLYDFCHVILFLRYLELEFYYTFPAK
jgi:hypothetical protein